MFSSIRSEVSPFFQISLVISVDEAVHFAVEGEQLWKEEAGHSSRSKS